MKRRVKKRLTFDDIKDELCYCGALKSQHGKSRFGIPGHGSYTKTGCLKFTWKSFILKTAKEKKAEKYAVLVGGKIASIGDSDKITFTKETALSMAKTLKGEVVEMKITGVAQ